MPFWPSPSWFRSHFQWLAFAVAALLAAAITFGVARSYGERSADDALAAQGLSALRLQISALQAELDKQRAIRFVILGDAEIVSTLSSPSQDAMAQLNAKLAALNAAVGASVIYLINANGVAVASSNYLDATSFIGNDFQFRSYFRDAMD